MHYTKERVRFSHYTKERGGVVLSYYTKERGGSFPLHAGMTCIKTGSDESHFNVSLIVRDKVTRQCPQTTTVEEKGEPKRY